MTVRAAGRQPAGIHRATGTVSAWLQTGLRCARGGHDVGGHGGASACGHLGQHLCLDVWLHWSLLLLPVPVPECPLRQAERTELPAARSAGPGRSSHRDRWPPVAGSFSPVRWRPHRLNYMERRTDRRGFPCHLEHRCSARSSTSPLSRAWASVFGATLLIAALMLGATDPAEPAATPPDGRRAGWRDHDHRLRPGLRAGDGPRRRRREPTPSPS